MQFLPATKSWRTAFLCALALFVLSRLVMLTRFPIFNDEAIYLPYSQAIHDDWTKNKFISLDNSHGDWKPPLQYWLAAPFIRFGNDPLVIGRSVALVVSILGVFGFYAFARVLFGEREGVVAACLYVLCPSIFFHNDQSTAEPFLFSIAPFAYWSLLKAMEPGQRRWAWALLAFLFAVVLLLLKQSGLLLIGISVFLPFASPRLKTSTSPNELSRRSLVINLGVSAGVIVLSILAARALLPAEFNSRRDTFHGHVFFSLQDLLQLPTGLWRANMAMAADYVHSYYTWFAMIFLAAAVWLAARRRDFAELTLVAMCLTGACGIIFLLRWPNEYLLNAAVIAVLLPLLARAGTVIWNLAPDGSTRFLRSGLLALGMITIGCWIYQDLLMAFSPGRYFERSTAWARRNYLKSWPTGFGVKEVVAMLEKEKGAGIILADPQWGNPRAALELYKDRFPNLQIVPFRRQMVDPAVAREFRKWAENVGPARFAIYSAATGYPREEWQAVIEREICNDRTEVKEYPTQAPIVVCRF